MAARDDNQEPVGSGSHGNTPLNNMRFSQERLDETVRFHSLSKFIP